MPLPCWSVSRANRCGDPDRTSSIRHCACYRTFPARFRRRILRDDSNLLMPRGAWQTES